jgi:hypothetical protein
MTVESVAASIVDPGAAGAAPPMPTTREGAQARIAEIKKGGEFGKRLLAGDVGAKQEWRQLHEIAHAPPVSSAPAASLTNAIDHLSHEGIDPGSEVGKDLVSMLSGEKALTPLEARQVDSRWQAMKRDSAFRERFLRGDLVARQTMATLTVLRMAQVRESS